MVGAPRKLQSYEPVIQNKNVRVVEAERSAASWGQHPCSSFLERVVFILGTDSTDSSAPDAPSLLTSVVSHASSTRADPVLCSCTGYQSTSVWTG